LVEYGTLETVIEFDADLEPNSIAAQLSGRRRVLLFGPPGSGKSTLAAELAAVFAHGGAACACLGGDPGSPAFGVPGAVCMGRWSANGWVCADMEPLCTLDAARFRLPLIQAVGGLMKRAPQQMILLDAPGVVRGAAAAELLAGFVESAGIDAMVSLQRHAETSLLVEEIRAMGLFLLSVHAAAEAGRPARSARDRRRTGLWDKYLEQAAEYQIDLNAVASIGTPPPRDGPSAWVGRQVALMNGNRCVAFGEALQLDRHTLRAKLCGDPRGAQTILIRDAARHANGLLRTVEPFRESMTVSPPPDMSAANASPTGRSHQLMTGGYLRTPPEPRPVARVGSVTAMLVNGVFGDPLLHIRLQHQRRSLLFDLGETTRLPARIAHQVTDVFISHAHIDHIGGFVWLLRSRIGTLPACRVFGPPGLADNVMGFISGIHWDRVGERAPRFDVSELHNQQIWRYRIQAGKAKPEILGDEPASGGILLRDPAFQVRATTLDHGTPVLAFALQMTFDLNVRKDRLAELGLTPGPWLSDLKAYVASGEREATIALPNGTAQTAGHVADEVLILRPGPKLAYATDLADTLQNRTRLQKLAEGAHTFFCEAPFCEADTEQSARTGHLTAGACGEIATAAHVERLVPFHFSRRYQDEPERVYTEVSASCMRTVIPWQIRRPDLRVTLDERFL
jgi:ribonuclease BN (tRNA processing enzyme)